LPPGSLADVTATRQRNVNSTRANPFIVLMLALFLTR
jgi:ABC-type methionine transport system permease subunit